jgi:hypothetical protein
VKPLTLLLLCIILIPALACSTTSIAESLVPSGGVLYQDFFSNPQSGWGELNNAAGTAGYIDDAYHIVVNQAHVNLWTHPGKDFSNVKVEVSSMPVAGPQANRMGLICRLQDDKNFYFFVISADGYYGIGKMKAGQTGLLTGSQMQPHNSILVGSQINRMRATCIGNVLTLFVNDTLVTSVTDADFTTGDVGILAGSFDEPGEDVYFDNFVVYKP